MSAAVVEVAPGVGMCLHPDATTEYRRQRGGWRRVRAGRGWRLVRGREAGVYAMRCPDCPAVEYRFDTGFAVAPVMAPWLVPLGVRPRFGAAVEAHKGHRQAGLRLDWDGVYRCPECEPVPPQLVLVRRVVPGCWEAWCRQCALLAGAGLVAQVGSWERAMARVQEHLATMHGVTGKGGR